jgi:hypothetical protein
MYITERDIFNSVFFPHLIPDELRDEITLKFKNESIFYQQLKSTIETPLTETVKKKLSKRIPAYTPSVILYPLIPDVQKKKSDRPILAAASPDSDSIKIFTFIDQLKKYIIRILIDNNKSKIFVFSGEYEVIHNYKIRLSPEADLIPIENNLNPLELPYVVEANQIELII